MMNSINLLAEVDMNSVLNNGMSVPERLLDGGRMILLGMAAVFAVLFIIWFLLTVFRFFVYDIPKMRAGKSDAATPNCGPSAGGSVSACAAVAPEADDGRLIAVITAAVAALRAEESEDALPFKVVSFSRRNQGRPWNR